MNVLKKIFGFVFLLLGAFFMFAVIMAAYNMHIVNQEYRHQDGAETLGNIIGFALIAGGAAWLLKKGWQWLTFRKPPDPALGRDDILDDGDLHQQPNP